MPAERKWTAAEVDAILERAVDLTEQGELDQARELVLDAMRDADEEPTLLCWLGVAAEEQGETGAAYEYFRRCLALGPDAPATLAIAGRGLAALDDPAAEGALRSAALLGPGMLIARLEYGVYLCRQGLLEEAAVELQAARELEPEDAEVHGALGVLHWRAGRVDQALREWGEAVALDPENATVGTLYGLGLLESGRGQEAAEELYAAALRAPEEGELQLLCSLACAAQGWDDEAWNALARAEAAGAEGEVLTAAEEHLEEGADAAEALLRAELAPLAFRERLSRSLR